MKPETPKIPGCLGNTGHTPLPFSIFPFHFNSSFFISRSQALQSLASYHQYEAFHPLLAIFLFYRL